MADIADIAQVAQDMILKAQVTDRADDKCKHTVKCHWCDDEVKKDQVFCDSDCADALHDFLKRQ